MQGAPEIAGPSASGRRHVLVVGDNARAALAMCRSLGPASFRVSILRLGEIASPADASRYCSASLFIGQPERGVKAWTQRFEDLLRSGAYTHVVPTDEIAHELVCTASQEATAPVRLLCPGPQRLECVTDLTVALRVAAEAGLRGATSTRLSLGDELRSVSFPCVVRPIRAAAINGDETAYYSTRIVDDWEALDAKLRDDLSRVDVLLQPPECGERVALCMAAIDGRLLALSMARRLDPEGARLVSEAPSFTLQTAARDFASRLGWSGLLRIECTRVQDELTVVDVRPGPGDLLAVSAFAGVDLPRIAVEGANGQLGEKLLVSSAGVCVRHLWADLAARAPLRRRRRSRARGSQDRSTGESVRTHLEAELLADFRPAIAQLSVAAGRFIRRARMVLRAAIMRPRRILTNDERLRPSDRILFVCQGNINRSVVAEHLLRAQGFRNVASAGLLTMSGRRPSRPAEEFIISRLRLGTVGIRSRSVYQALAGPDEIDVIICFERLHIVELRNRFPRLGTRVMLLTQFANSSAKSLDVADPHGRTEAEYRACFDEVERLLAGAVAN